MPKKTALRVVDELAAAGCEKVSLSGGEPTLSPYWSDVAEAGTRSGMRMNMIVNAAHHDRAFVRRAKDSGLVNLGVSLDGLQESHDRNRRTPGLFRKVDKLLEDCAVENLPVGVITTVWKGNQHELPAMQDFLTGRVFSWQVQLAAAMGNLRRADQLVPDDLLDLVPVLANLVERDRVNVQVADNIGYFGPYEEVIRKRRSSPLPCWVGCYAGCQHLGIQADGGVKGCLSLQSITATEGNLREQSLANIWNRPGAFDYNRAFTLDDLSGFCRTCVHAEVCRGGCLSMRTCEGGRDNPFCYHRVATLAARRTKKVRSRYSSVTYAPAALLALLGLTGPGCGKTSIEVSRDAQIANQDLYGASPPDARLASPETIYGIAIPPDAGLEANAAGPEVGNSDLNDLPTEVGQAKPEVGGIETYAVYADAFPVDHRDGPNDPRIYPSDVYGVPADVPVYGIATPDARDGKSADSADARQPDGSGVDSDKVDSGAGD